MEILSEHTCEGWLEGYLLTGRHGMFACYEAFTTIVDSMVNQYAKWLKLAREIPWRTPVASLNFLLTSHSWRQDHNGYSHQAPGFINTLLTKKSEMVCIYLPPDTNSLFAVTEHCLRTPGHINLIVVGKQPNPQWLDLKAAQEHVARGAGIWPWASAHRADGEPDVVLVLRRPRADPRGPRRRQTSCAVRLPVTCSVRVDQRGRPHASASGRANIRTA